MRPSDWRLIEAALRLYADTLNDAIQVRMRHGEDDQVERDERRRDRCIELADRIRREGAL